MIVILSPTLPRLTNYRQADFPFPVVLVAGQPQRALVAEGEVDDGADEVGNAFSQ